MQAKALPRCAGPYPREIMSWTGEYIYSPLFNQFFQSSQARDVSRCAAVLSSAEQLIHSVPIFPCSNLKPIYDHCSGLSSESDPTRRGFAVRENDYVWGHQKVHAFTILNSACTLLSPQLILRAH